MAQIQGQFLHLIVSLMSLYPKAIEEAEGELYNKFGKHLKDIDPKEFYDSRFHQLFLDAYKRHSPTGSRAMVTLGKMVYPTFKKTIGLPPNLKTPLDFIKFEAEGFLQVTKGPDVKPRKFLRFKEGDVLVEATTPGYDSNMNEGIYMGILDMCGVKSGKVVQTKRQEENGSVSEFHITWK